MLENRPDRDIGPLGDRDHRRRRAGLGDHLLGSRNDLAARLGCAILHGPDVDDFEEIYAALDNAGGGALVFDAETLAKQLALLFFDKAELRAMARAAAETAEDFGGASTRTMQAIEPYLAQAIIAARGREG